MYVNEDSLDYGEKGKEAIRRLLSEAEKRRLIPKGILPEFVGEEVRISQ